MKNEVKKSIIKTVPTKAKVSEYLKAIKDPARQKDCQTLKNLMKKITGKKPIMWGATLVGFSTVIQTYASGRKVEWLQMGFSSRKEAISLYMTCDLDQFQSELKKLGKYKRGVGCLYVKHLSDIDMLVLEKMLRKSLKGYLYLNK